MILLCFLAAIVLFLALCVLAYTGGTRASYDHDKEIQP